MNIFDILRRAQANQPLTPAERATLKVLKGLLITFILAAWPVADMAISTLKSGMMVNVDWAQVIHNAFVAGAEAVAFAGWKYVNAKSETPAASAPGVATGTNDLHGMGLDVTMSTMQVPVPNGTSTQSGGAA